MQYALQVFETEERNPFRTVMIDGDPWFVAADVARELGYRDASNAVRLLDEDEKGTHLMSTPGGSQNVTVVSEPGFYKLVSRSTKPEAKRLDRWVRHTVLPSIRKTGRFGNEMPAFIRRANENYDRVEEGYFSVINELFVRVYGRFERMGYMLVDKGPDGRELRPDVSVGRTFADWIRKHHPDLADAHSEYLHWTEKAEFFARQYPNVLLGVFVEFLEQVWIKEYAPAYFRKRDPGALTHLPKLLPSSTRAAAATLKVPRFKHRHPSIQPPPNARD